VCIIHRIRQEIPWLYCHIVYLDLLPHIPAECSAGYGNSKCFADDELENGELVLPGSEGYGRELFVEGDWRGRVSVCGEEGGEFVNGFGFPEGVRSQVYEGPAGCNISVDGSDRR